MAPKHARIFQHPLSASLQGALLDSYASDRRGGQLFISLNLRALERTSSVLCERAGLVHECVQGSYVPTQLRFFGISGLTGSDFFTSLTGFPPNDPIRTISDLLSWRPPGKRDVFYLFFMEAPKASNLMFFARGATYERFTHEAIPVTLERDWSSAPPLPKRLVPQPKHLHRRFGGDPISIRANGRVHHRKLFIGGTDIQPKRRPSVNVVLNLGETPSRWVKSSLLYPGDRAVNKGEGPEGMSLDEIQEEANWVIEHLQKNQSVLVHCAAGMNRSATICCAALMLLEGLSAEAALERVREQHPWARPDSHHWLKLRWLELNEKE